MMKLSTYTRALILVVVFVSSLSLGFGYNWQKNGWNQHNEAGAIPLIGGRSTITMFCTTPPGGFLIDVTPPRSGTFLIVPGGVTTVYAYWWFFGSWVLGDSFPGGVCCIGKFCRYADGTAMLIGTSM